MQNNNLIPTEKENLWSAFLNGEPDISDFSNIEAEENSHLTSVWESAGTHFSFSAADPDKAWVNLQNKLIKPHNNLIIRSIYSRIFKYAAMLVVVAGIGFAAYHISQTPAKVINLPVKMAVIETESHPSSLTEVTLPDGSIVKMNADTRIEYPVSFRGKVRKVKLSGEAFFKVTRDTLHPFLIETSNASIEVLGTSFNVSAYRLSDLVEVNVESGKVRLTQNVDGKPVSKSAILPAGERGWIKTANGEIGHIEILAPNYSSWITKKINFQRTPLSDAFIILENTYHVKIKMENAEIGRIPYTANFADSKLDYIIEVIARTHKLKAERGNDGIVFSKIMN